MKIKEIILKAALTSILVLMSIILISATEPGDPGSEPQVGDPPLGGGAPIGSGTLLLIGFGAAYSSNKIYNLYIELKEPEKE